jgi:hypothetical protein
MRGASLRSLKEGFCFDFRRARSLPPGPTITDRLTGLSRNLHGAATECQGRCSCFALRIRNKILTAIIHGSFNAARHYIDTG